VVVQEWLEANPHPAWRRHSDEVNGALVSRWLPPSNDGRILKTDLFDEIASDGLYSVLATRARYVCGMDVSAYTAAAASSKYPEIAASAADIRSLPFADSSFDAIVSLSTIDHFNNSADIPRSLVELRRVLRPGGTLVLTVDNLSNPLIALRNSLPYPFLRRLGLVSYPVGRSLTFQRARECVLEAGFTVLDAVGVMLSPRVLAIPVLELVSRRGSKRMTGMLRKTMMWMERFQSTVVARRLAHFVAIRAVKASSRSRTR
jgi:SAM-dependent methyltransferase